MQAVASPSFIQALEEVDEYWSPRVIGRVNDQYIKVAKLKGQLTWHKHDDEDEMFIVVYGRLLIQMEGNKEVLLDPGEFYVIPRGISHNPVADEECGIVLIESVTTKHTGDVVISGTKSIEEQLGLKR